MGHETRGDVRPAVASAGLVQVGRVRPQHRDLAPGQPGAQHQRGEPVADGGSDPRRIERLSQASPGRLRLGGVPEQIGLQPEVVDEPVDPISVDDDMGAFVGDFDP